MSFQHERTVAHIYVQVGSWEHDNRGHTAPAGSHRSKGGGPSHHNLVALAQKHHVNEARPN